jgi:hypothetical protein
VEKMMKKTYLESTLILYKYAVNDKSIPEESFVGGTFEKMCKDLIEHNFPNYMDNYALQYTKLLIDLTHCNRVSKEICVEYLEKYIKNRIFSEKSDELYIYMSIFDLSSEQNRKSVRNILTEMLASDRQLKNYSLSNFPVTTKALLS